MNAGEEYPVLRDLEIEVDADLELISASGVDEADLGLPAEWQFDPVEAQEEEVELRSLRGAIEALEADHGSDPGSAVSSG